MKLWDNQPGIDNIIDVLHNCMGGCYDHMTEFCNLIGTQWQCVETTEACTSYGNLSEIHDDHFCFSFQRVSSLRLSPRSPPWTGFPVKFWKWCFGSCLWWSCSRAADSCAGNGMIPSWEKRWGEGWHAVLSVGPNVIAWTHHSKMGLSWLPNHP